MQRLLRAIAALALCVGLTIPALADSTVHGLSTNSTSPLPASSCFYVDQGSTTDTKLCSGYATAIGALAAANNLSDLTNVATAQTNLGLGPLTATDGTHSVASTTTLSLGNGFGVSGTSPTANVAMVAPDRTLTASGGSVAAGDMAGQVNLNGSSLSFNVSAIGAGVWNTGASAILNDLNSTSVALTNTATVNGCGTTLYSGGFFSYTSNGTSLDCFGFPGFGWMAANAITVSTVTGKSRVVTTGTTDTLLSSDCGEEVIYNLAAFTVTVPSAIVPASGSVCTIRIRTATANKVTISGSGVTVTSADSYTGTQAIAGSGISLDLTTVGATATAYLDGHGS